jgi:RNA polymerase sigma-70 factor (ECF subfamily)
MEQPEKVWLAEYRAGRVEAMGSLVDHFRRPLFGFIAKMMEGHADAEEIFQEVWIRALTNLHRYRDDRFLSWLFRIAHNLVIDRARRGKRLVELDRPQDEDGGTLQDRLAAPVLGPDAEAHARDLGERIGAAVRKLPDEQREVFLLRTEGELPFKEIARIQGVSINTALARMQYALQKLRVELKDDYAALGRV